MLTQKARPEDHSLVEYLIGYLLRSQAVTGKDLEHFRPSVCNRLDRNTSGIVAAGKTVAGLQELGKLFHDRTMDKYYRCVVKGELREACRLEGYLAKDGEANQVRNLSGREGRRPAGLYGVCAPGPWRRADAAGGKADNRERAIRSGPTCLPSDIPYWGIPSTAMKN